MKAAVTPVVVCLSLVLVGPAKSQTPEVPPASEASPAQPNQTAELAPVRAEEIPPALKPQIQPPSTSVPEQPTAPLPPLPPPSPTLVDPVDPVEQAPSSLHLLRTGTWQPGMLIQGWYYWDKQADNATSTFKLRRAELRVKGEVIEKSVGFELMLDAARVTDGAPETGKKYSPLQDVFMTYKHEFAEVSFGQFKIPVSWEGYNSSSKLLFPERALVAREIGDRRDIGVRVAKTYQYFGYVAGLFNGGGQNTTGPASTKDLALRLEAYPVQGVTVAAVGYTTVGDRDDRSRDTLEGDIRVEHEDVLLQAEYLHTHVKSAGTSRSQQGYYGTMAYTLWGKFQPAVRFGWFEQDVDRSASITHVEGGLSYLVEKHNFKLQGSYGVFMPRGLASPDAHQAILAAQVSY